jgi:hypothetical protein
MMLCGTPSFASSTAWAWRSWWGARTAAAHRRRPRRGVDRRGRRRSTRAAHGSARRSRTAADGPAFRSALRPKGGAAPSPTGPCPTSRRLPPLPWRTHRPSAGLQVVLGESERLLDAQPRPPQQHDQGPQTGAMDAAAGLAHDRDDLLDRGRIATERPPTAGPESSRLSEERISESQGRRLAPVRTTRVV